MSDEAHYEVVIVGGGSAGISVAARLAALPNPPSIAIIEPSDKHYYQPIWTLVGGGVFPKEISEREEADFIPFGVTWIREKVASFEPERDAITTESGKTLRYDDLVVAIGNHDPCADANVMARGIVGDMDGQLVVASPIYKQHFNLITGKCLEDGDVGLPVWEVKVEGDTVWVRRGQGIEATLESAA